MQVHTLIISTADWDRPLWTNKQYVARELAQIGPVTYLNSLGLRRPRANPDDLRRIGRRLLRGGPRPSHRRVEGVATRSPLVVPWHRRTTPIWQLNRASIRRSTGAWRSPARGSRVLWTFSPITYDLEKDADLVVYHSVDLLEHIEGVDPLALQQGEQSLSAHPGLVTIASSSQIARHLERRGLTDVKVWENVADVDLIEDVVGSVQPRAGHLVFAGNLTPQKVDFELLQRVVESNPALHLHLAGPVADGGGPKPDLRWFDRHPRVRRHGVLDPTALARLMGSCTVGLIPYRKTRYTEGVFPMKAYEYLAAGLAVVSTDLPALRDLPQFDSCESSNAFVESVIAKLDAPDPSTVVERKELARRHSWGTRGRQIRNLVNSHLGQDRCDG